MKNPIKKVTKATRLISLCKYLVIIVIIIGRFGS